MRAASLFLFLAGAKVAGIWGSDLPLSPLTPVALFWEDALVAGLFLLFDRAVRRPRIVWSLYGLLVFYTLVNVPVVRIVATPITGPMFRAAGGAMTDSFLRYATAGNIALLVGGALLAVALPLLLRRVRSRPVVVFTLLVLLVAAGPTAVARVETRGLHRTAVVAIVRSTVPRVETHAANEDWRAPISLRTAEDRTALRGLARGRDVLLVILESAGAIHLKPWGGDTDPMPNLSRLAATGLLYENAYTVYPESVKGLVAILGSLHPAIDTHVESWANRSFPTIASQLSHAGYETALWHSGRFDYLGMRGIVTGRGFDHLLDAGRITGRLDSSFGADEEKTVTKMLEWIDRRDAGRPYFLTYMPIAGHHPYDCPEPGPFTADTEFGAYRNALHYGDRQLQRLLDGLESRGRLGNTLIVAVGDHGEAFDNHPGNIGHTFFIYEENVRVPLVIAAPGSKLPAVRDSRIVSHVDLAPTILDLLGLPIPADFEGASLLEPEPRAALFFTDYSLALLGLRDGDLKAIHEVESGRTRVFDLRTDPAETTDRSAAHADFADRARTRLLRWSAATRAKLGQ